MQGSGTLKLVEHTVTGVVWCKDQHLTVESHYMTDHVTVDSHDSSRYG